MERTWDKTPGARFENDSSYDYMSQSIIIHESASLPPTWPLNDGSASQTGQSDPRAMRCRNVKFPRSQPPAPDTRAKKTGRLRTPRFAPLKMSVSKRPSWRPYWRQILEWGKCAEFGGRYSLETIRPHAAEANMAALLQVEHDNPFHPGQHSQQLVKRTRPDFKTGKNRQRMGRNLIGRVRRVCFRSQRFAFAPFSVLHVMRSLHVLSLLSGGGKREK